MATKNTLYLYTGIKASYNSVRKDYEMITKFQNKDERKICKYS